MKRQMHCKLALLMATHEPPLNQSDVSRSTKLGINTIGRLYNNTFKGIETDTIVTLCDFFACDLPDLFELRHRQSDR